MSELILLLLLFLRGKSTAPPGQGFPSPPAAPVVPPTPAPVGPTPAPGEPVKRKCYGVPPGTKPGPGWYVYDPLNPWVISEAQAVLRSGVLRVIKPDPVHDGRALFQRECDPKTGHIRVTAWSGR